MKLKKNKLIKTTTCAAAIICAGAIGAPVVYAALPATNVEAAENVSALFTFTDSSIAASGDSGYEINGTTLNITANGTYKITGSAKEGSIVVAKGLSDVKIILSDADISSSSTAPIVIKKGSNVILEVEGSNKLSDREDISTEDTNADFEGAAIKVKSGSNLKIQGTGSLSIDASSCKNGIKGASCAAITIDGSQLSIKAANTGLASDGSVTVNGGVLNIEAANDGIKSEPDEGDSESEGIVTINGGTLNLNVTTPDSSDAIWGYNAANVYGGVINITAGDDAIHSEYVTNIGKEGYYDGPVIKVNSCVEGFEGAVVNLYAGSGDITSSDDGINAANGDLTGYSYAINIYGGTWRVNAQGDAIDSNGDVNMSGGVVEAFGSSNGGNSALDFDGKCNVTGGKLLAVGMSEMAQAPTTGTYTAFNNVSVKQGSSVQIKDANGNTVYEFTGVKNAKSVVYAGDGLTSGETYTLIVDGSQAGSASTNNLQNGFGGGFGRQNGNAGFPGFQEGPGGERPEFPNDQNGQRPEMPNDQNGQRPEMPNDQNGQRPDFSRGRNQLRFDDVTNTQSAFYTPIYWASQRGITTGVTPNLFMPDNDCTRGQVVTFLWRAAGSPEPASSENPFSDVSEDSAFYKAIIWASENNITTGFDDGTFRQDESCTRGQIVTFLCRYAKGSAEEGTKNPFSDLKQENNKFYDAILWAISGGITKGFDDGTFRQDNTCTRGQAVTFLYRLLESSK